MAETKPDGKRAPCAYCDKPLGKNIREVKTPQGLLLYVCSRRCRDNLARDNNWMLVGQRNKPKPERRGRRRR